MYAKKDQMCRLELIRQLKKKYRYATGGSGRRFFLAFALRQLRARGKQEPRKRKTVGGWTITVASQEEDSIPEEMEEGDVEEDASLDNFSINVEDSRLVIPSGYSCPLAIELARLDNMAPPVQKVLDGSIEKITLPAVVYSLLIEEHFDQSSCVALALSGAFLGFSPLYKRSRQRKGLVINEQCFYLKPDSFSTFIDQHISLESISVLNLNNCYWLPAHLLEITIVKMSSLEDLSIKGTQVSTFRQVAKILQSCNNIKSFDFTFTEKTEEEIEDGLRKENITIDSFTKGFQKLVGLKLSTTTVPDPKYGVFKDPWLPIFKILSCCRDCTKLTIEVTYPMKDFNLVTLRETYNQFETEVPAREDWQPLEWMKALESLVLIKLGGLDPHQNAWVKVPLLGDLFGHHLFPYKETPIIPRRPMRCLWIENIFIPPTNDGHDFDPLKYLSPECLTSFKTGNMLFMESPEDNNEDDQAVEDTTANDNMLFGLFRNIKNLGGMRHLRFNYPLSSLQKLKYASGIVLDDGEFYKFCEAHPELEHLSVWHSFSSHSSPDKILFKLLKLKSFFCSNPFSKEFVEAMIEAYPNLEILQLATYYQEMARPFDDTVLSALSFPKLVSLTLTNFKLEQGSFLLKIIESSPKLEILHLETASMKPTPFLANLKSFLRQATKLRDIRLKWNYQYEDFLGTILSLLSAILKESVLLERLVLIDGGPSNSSSYTYLPGLDDAFVNFAAKMTHMTCCCITSNQIDSDHMKAIKQRVEEEVLPERPSLWFHMGRTVPEASDTTMPPIHYCQIVDPQSFDMPRVFE